MRSVQYQQPQLQQLQFQSQQPQFQQHPQVHGALEPTYSQSAREETERAWRACFGGMNGTMSDQPALIAAATFGEDFEELRRSPMPSIEPMMVDDQPAAGPSTVDAAIAPFGKDFVELCTPTPSSEPMMNDDNTNGTPSSSPPDHAPNLAAFQQHFVDPSQANDPHNKGKAPIYQVHREAGRPTAQTGGAGSRLGMLSREYNAHRKAQKNASQIKIRAKERETAGVAKKNAPQQRKARAKSSRQSAGSNQPSDSAAATAAAEAELGAASSAEVAKDDDMVSLSGEDA